MAIIITYHFIIGSFICLSYYSIYFLKKSKSAGFFWTFFSHYEPENLVPIQIMHCKNCLAKSFARYYNMKFGRNPKPMSALSAIVNFPSPFLMGRYLTTKYLQVNWTQSGLIFTLQSRYSCRSGLSWIERVKRKTQPWVLRREYPIPWKNAYLLDRKGQLFKLQPILQFLEKIFSCFETSLKAMNYGQRSISVRIDIKISKGSQRSISIKTPTEFPQFLVHSLEPFLLDFSYQLPLFIYSSQCRISACSLYICFIVFKLKIQASPNLAKRRQ